MADTAQEKAEQRFYNYRCPCVGTNDPRCRFPDCPEGGDDE